MGTEGIEEATGMNIAKDVINHFADGENRYTVQQSVVLKKFYHKTFWRVSIKI